MTRVAAIDCGTNSIRLLVADYADGALKDLDRRMEVVRLGEGVDRTGRLSDAALERTFAACRRYAAIAADLGATRTRFVATSASRDAENRDVFVSGVRQILGVEPEVITGEEEALLSFVGATRELAGHAEPPYLVVDVGGGSTEFVLGDGEVSAACSVNIGCVRLTERHLHGDPPTQAEIDEARAAAEEAVTLAAATVPLASAHTLVGVAGSVTTMAAAVMDLPEYDPERIHLSRLTLDEITATTRRLLSMTHEQREALPYMHPGRADVIAAGTLIFEVVARRVGVTEVVVSEHDILDGIALLAVENAS